jgi:5-methylcytosine-specific restriction endonuclease McrA
MNLARYPRISDIPDKFDGRCVKLCRDCDNQVTKGRRHYCSDRCMNHFVRNNFWAFVRKDVLKRDNYRCNSVKRDLGKGSLKLII